MLLNLFLKLWATPENIFGLILNILTIISLCLIFKSWNEKWWKSLVPIYGTYILYKHTWKRGNFIFLLPLASDILSARCLSLTKRELVGDVFETLNMYLETEQLGIDVDMHKIIFLIALFGIFAFISFLFTRITYVKICDKLLIHNPLLKIGTFLLPEVFLFIDYMIHRKKITK